MSQNQDYTTVVKNASSRIEEVVVGEEMLINMGPQHPSTHGVLRLLLELDGEIVVSCVPDIGYLHTGVETYNLYKVGPDRVELYHVHFDGMQEFILDLPWI